MSVSQAPSVLGSLLNEALKKDERISCSLFPFRAARVTGADWNGKEWSLPNPLPLTSSSASAETAGYASMHVCADEAFYRLIEESVNIGSRGTDYAWFGVTDEYGNTTWAGPGDYLVTLDGKKLIVVPGAFFKMIFKED